MEALDPQTGDGDVPMIEPEPATKTPVAAAASPSSADLPAPDADSQKTMAGCLAPPAPQDEVPGLSTSSSASESSAARSPPPVELDFDHPVRHVQPAFFYPTPGAVPADYYVHSRPAIGPGARTHDANRGLDADGELYLDPEEDEECKRGIPVFKPTMEEFVDFEGYMNLVDHWGRRSGIVKVIPPDEWIDALPKIPAHAIAGLKIKSPIQQHMQGRAGLFRVNNVERKKPLTVKDWFQKCTSPQYRTPNLHETSRSDRPVTGVKKKEEPTAASQKPKHPNQWTYRKTAAKAEAAAAEAALIESARGEGQANPAHGDAAGAKEPMVDVAPAAPTAPDEAVTTAATPSELALDSKVETDGPLAVVEADVVTSAVAPLAPTNDAPASDKQDSTTLATSVDIVALALISAIEASPSTSETVPSLASTTNVATAPGDAPLPEATGSEATYAVAPARKKVVALYTYRPKPIPRPPPLETVSSEVQAAAVVEADAQAVRRKQPNQWTYRNRDNSTASTSASAAVAATTAKVPEGAVAENGQPVRRKQPNQWTYRDAPKPASVPKAASSRAVMVLDENGQLVKRKQPNQHTYRNQAKPQKLPPLVLDVNGNWVKRKQPNQHTYRVKAADGNGSTAPSERAGATFDFVPPLTALTESALDKQNAATASSPSRRLQSKPNSERPSDQMPGSPASSALSSTLSSAPALEGEEPIIRRKQPNQHTYRNSSKADSVASSSAQPAAGEAPAKKKHANQYTYRTQPKTSGSSIVDSSASSGGNLGLLADAIDGREMKPLPAAVKRKQPNQWTYRDSPKVLAAAASGSPAPSASSHAADAEAPARRKQPNQWTYRDAPKAAPSAVVSPAGAVSSPAVKPKRPNQWTYRDKPKAVAASAAPVAPVAGQKRKQPNQWTYRNKAVASAPAPVIAPSMAPAPAAAAEQPPPTAEALTPATAGVVVIAAEPSAEPHVALAFPPLEGAATDTVGVEPMPDVSGEATTSVPTRSPPTPALGQQMATIAAALRSTSPDARLSATPAVVVENMEVDPKQEVDIAPVAAVVAAVDAAEAQATSASAEPDAAVPDDTPAGEQVRSTIESAAAPADASSIEPAESFTSNPAPRKRRKTPPPEEDLDPWYETLLEKKEWMPEGTKASDFTEEACRELERKFWRGLGVGESAWYGADLQGSFFTEETTEWNVAALPNLLNRLKMRRQLPGVNTPYLYWGMWRAAFAWHVEDMDLYSVNYLHFGAPKFWYAVPQAKADALERTMRSYFPSDVSECDQFLRHKSFAASPQRLSHDACRPNVLVQHPNEFVFTFPRGYHSGFNTGFNCAESINFALDSWIDLGRKARFCTCIDDSVRIDVDAILREHQMLADLEEQRNIRAEQERERLLARTQLGERKRLATPQAAASEVAPAKKLKAQPSAMAPIPMPRIILKEPKPAEPVYPCVLCASESAADLLECTAVPPSVIGKNKVDGKRFFAHALCAEYIPETHVIELELEVDGVPTRRKFVDGVCDIPKDRWNLGCSVCTRPVLKKMGGKIQCDKGKCPRAFHVTCAQANEDTILREFDHSEMVLVSEDPLDTRQVQLTTRKRECVCSSHNPAAKERKRLEALARHRSVILSYKPYDRIKIRSKSGMIYEVPLIAISSERETVSVYWVDGRSVETPWSTVIDPASSAPKPTAPKATAKKNAPPAPASVALISTRPFDHTRGEQLFKPPGPAPRKFVTAPLDLSDVDPALLGAPWEVSPPAFPALSAGGRSLQISPAVQRLLQKDRTLLSLFESVGWPVIAPRPPTIPSGPSAPAAVPAPIDRPVLAETGYSTSSSVAGPGPTAVEASMLAPAVEGAALSSQAASLGSPAVLATAASTTSAVDPPGDQRTPSVTPLAAPPAAILPPVTVPIAAQQSPAAAPSQPSLAEELAATPHSLPAPTLLAAEQSASPAPF